MTKYADAKLDETWKKLTDLDGCSGITAGDKVELYNAGNTEILYAEVNSGVPDDSTFCKIIPPRHAAKFAYTVAFFVKSAAATAKMIVSDYA